MESNHVSPSTNHGFIEGVLLAIPMSFRQLQSTEDIIILNYMPVKLVDTAGIEPASLLCQRSILPLNYRPIEIVLVDPVGNDPTTVWVWARCSNQLS